MEFSEITGKIDAATVKLAEKHLTKVFTELGLRYDNVHSGAKFGGDPAVFVLVYPMKHICTEAIDTAATDGRQCYWNPYFVNALAKRSPDLLGLRFVIEHEAWHSLCMHPSRRQHRNPRLWNIAVDYVVNNIVLEDLKSRNYDAARAKEAFNKNLGKYITMEQYASVLKDPENAWQKLPADIKNIFSPANKKKAPKGSSAEKMKAEPKEEKELSPAEKQQKFDDRMNDSCFFADQDLEEQMRRPEPIYNYLLNCIPKCPECGKLGHYTKKKKGKQDPQPNGNDKGKDKGKDKGQNPGDDGDDGKDKGDGHGDKHDHGDGNPCDCSGGDQPGGDQPGKGDGSGEGEGDGEGQGCSSGGGCGTCGGEEFDFGFGSLVDDHMDSEESEEEMARRYSEAIDQAKKMAGTVPAGMEAELGLLSAPKISWKDFIRSRLNKARAGNGRNDWTRFKNRPLFYGQMVPKRKTYLCKFGFCLDASGSMSPDDMAFAVSQLQSLDERCEGVLVSADCGVYWDTKTILKKVTPETLDKVEVSGGGGTYFASEFVNNYEEHLGECDLLIIGTDAYLSPDDVAKVTNPGIPVVWLITSGVSDFKPPFGKVFDLRAM